MAPGSSASLSIASPPAVTAAEKKRASRTQLLKRLHAKLQHMAAARTGATNVLIPVRNKKTVGQWRGDMWTQQLWELFVAREGGCGPFLERYDVAVVNKTWIVLDVDGQDKTDGDRLCASFEERWPALRTCPAESTSKGRHYYFQRTEKCDELGIVGGVRPLRDPDSPLSPTDGPHRGKLPIDVLAVARTGSGRIVVVAPSDGKEWLLGRALWELDMPLFPDVMALDFARLRGGSAVPVKRVDMMTADERAAYDKERDEERRANVKESFGDVDPDVVSLVALLNPSRASNFQDWTTVGLRLKNAGNNKDTFLPVWQEFSALADKPDTPEEIERKWGKLNADARYSAESAITALCAMAREDNPEGYKEWRASSERGCLLTAVAVPNHANLARLFLSMVGRDTIVSISNVTCYVYQPPKWVKHDVTALSTLITQVLPRKLQTHRESLPPAGPEPSQEAKAEHAAWKQRTKQLAALNKLIAELGDIRFLNHVSRMVATLTLDLTHTFEAELDTRELTQDFLVFLDGVYDLARCEFRSGRPSDMSTLCTGIRYADVQAVTAEQIAAYKAKIEPIIPDKEERDFVLGQLATCLSGCKKHDKIHFWTGPSGGNGKTTLMLDFTNGIGKYAGQLHAQDVCQEEKSAASANVLYALLKGCRFLYFEEPSADGQAERTTRMNAGTLKKITGGCRVKARLNFGNSYVEYVPMWMLFALCNRVPDLPGDDGGLRRRVCNKVFRSQFVENPADVDHSEHRFLANPDFRDNKEDGIVLVRILLSEYWRPDIVKRFSVPAQIKQDSEALMAGNNLYAVFKGLCLKPTDYEHDWVEVSELRTRWSTYASDQATDLYKSKLPRVPDLIENFKRLLGSGCFRADTEDEGRRIKNGFRGWLMVQQQL